jgi:hypothetical protein
MVRVLRPGGRMAVQDFDWESQFCDSPNKETTRKIMLSLCDGMKNGWIGRRLPRLFREVGMTDISVCFQTITVPYDFLQLLLGGHVAREVSTGVLSEEEADLWWTDLARAEDDGTFLYGVTAFVVSGMKPESRQVTCFRELWSDRPGTEVIGLMVLPTPGGTPPMLDEYATREGVCWTPDFQRLLYPRSKPVPAI